MASIGPSMAIQLILGSLWRWLYELRSAEKVHKSSSAKTLQKRRSLGWGVRCFWHTCHVLANMYHLLSISWVPKILGPKTSNIHIQNNGFGVTWFHWRFISICGIYMPTFIVFLLSHSTRVPVSSELFIGEFWLVYYPRNTLDIKGRSTKQILRIANH